jgi:hypothetical protein
LNRSPAENGSTIQTHRSGFLKPLNLMIYILDLDSQHQKRTIMATTTYIKLAVQFTAVIYMFSSRYVIDTSRQTTNPASVEIVAVT